MYSFDAVIFDLDGVITKTAKVHSQAWKATFDEALCHLQGGEMKPFTDIDYLKYVDGKPRYDGVASFLESRGVHLPHGDPLDAPGFGSVCAVGNMKNEKFLDILKGRGPEVYESTVRLIHELREKGLKVGVASSSKNCLLVLQSIGMEGDFQARVDGEVSAELKLNGKPAPDIFVVAAERCGAKPDRAVVFEDAESGVQAGSRGGFALVVGLAREGNSANLYAHGADVVFDDWGERTVKDLDELVRAKRDRVPLPPTQS
eukprot:TRINITY_DN31508_c0_g1_i1.p1 TRINITY_DN31508_c0_g1~~TRINITY_DN31508_c0_g1_i1.p1  ORF type:complete len:259 (+),score=43.93 TRINITY_DN31508_c0_g1_i1:26-802(+)